MIAYKGDKKLKSAIVVEMKKHREADEIIKGTYGKQNGSFKGCAVGCAIDSLNKAAKTEWATDKHGVYESELGIPKNLAYLEDVIFEELPEGKAQDFAVSFLEAIRVGSDLSLVAPKFMVWLLADEKDGVIRFAQGDEFKEIHDAIKTVADLYQRIVDGGSVSDQEWKAAEKKADAARAAARDAARDAAWDAAWDAARAAAWDAAWAKMADKILSLIKEAK